MRGYGKKPTQSILEISREGKHLEINMRIILPILCLAHFICGAASASEFRAILGPAVVFEKPKSYGVIAGAMVHKNMVELTDIGFLLTAGSFHDGPEVELIGQVEIRQGLGEKIDLLFGVGGAAVSGGYGRFGDWEGYLHLSGGLAFNMEKSSIEVRFSPGGKQAEIYESSSLWVGWRLPISKNKPSDRRRSDGSLPLGI